MKYISTLEHPGTIMHPKLGRVQLGLLSQKMLKRLHQEGCPYIILEPGDPPVELEPVVSETPQKTSKPKKKSQPSKTEGAENDDKETPE